MADLATIDASSMDKWVARFKNELGVAESRLVRYELRLCLRDVIRWTGPTSLARGRENVKRDYRRSSEPVNTNAIRIGLARRVKGHQSVDVGGYQIASQDYFSFNMDRANQLIQKRDMTGFNALLQNIGGPLSKWKAVPFSTDLFKSADRGPRGGVKAQRKFIFELAAWRRDLARVQSNVGRRKAGWLPGYLQSGGKSDAIPNWVMKHYSGARGGFDFREHTVTATNRSLGVGKTVALARRAVNARLNAIRKDFHIFLKGIKDISTIQ